MGNCSALQKWVNTLRRKPNPRITIEPPPEQPEDDINMLVPPWISNSSINSIHEYFRRLEQSKGTILIALHSYKAQGTRDISITKGDIMYLLDANNADWWYVKKEDEDKHGFVPKNFVDMFTILEAEEWFAGKMSRSQAEQLLSGEEFPIGTFLVREQKTIPIQYALTLKAEDKVRHYKINRLSGAKTFFITSWVSFQSLRELVAHYKDNADGLCCRLTHAGPTITVFRNELYLKYEKILEIPRAEVKLGLLLGTGNFGKVYKAQWQGKVDIAVKTMKPGSMSTGDFLKEAQIMKLCNHPHLVKLYGVCTIEEPFYIILEYLSNGSLHSYLKNPQNTISEQTMINAAAQLASGMKYLEDRKLIHRDLAARNVLVGERIGKVIVVKIADFGLAKKLVDGEVYTPGGNVVIAIKWTAPEAAYSLNFTVKSDVWSFGVLLWEMFSRGETPYKDLKSYEVLGFIKDGHRMPRPETCPEKLYNDVVLNCWDEKPDKRPTFDFLLSYLDDYYVSSQDSYEL